MQNLKKLFMSHVVKPKLSSMSSHWRQQTRWTSALFLFLL